MSAIREALYSCECPTWAVNTDAALAELEAMERVVEAASALTYQPFWNLEQRYFYRLREALAELDGQHSNAAVTDRESTCCGDPGDCGENC